MSVKPVLYKRSDALAAPEPGAHQHADLEDDIARQWPINWKMIFAFWAAISLISLCVTYIHSLYMPDMTLGGGIFLTPYLLWALTTPLIFRMGQKVVKRGAPASSIIAALFAAGLLIAFLHSFLEESLYHLWGLRGSGYSSTAVGTLIHFILPALHLKFLTFCTILGAGFAIDYYRQNQIRTQHISRLQAQLVRAKLDALKMQLHPHFLFNTLNAISAYVERDPLVARRMIARLSELLRIALDSADTQEIPLEQELAFLRRYLDIEQVRFQDRLKIRVEADDNTLHALVPNMLFQPVVENAVRHGIAKQVRDGVIEIRATRDNGMLTVEIQDNGPGLAASPQESSGIGLRNTQERLRELYGSSFEFKMDEVANGGLKVRIAIPFHAEEQIGTTGEPDGKD